MKKTLIETAKDITSQELTENSELKKLLRDGQKLQKDVSKSLREMAQFSNDMLNDLKQAVKDGDEDEAEMIYQMLDEANDEINRLDILGN
jgi:phosphate uptake regulator